MWQPFFICACFITFDKTFNVKHKTKKFPKLPEYPGGKEAFRKYIKENLVYPKEALDKRIEGVVYLTADVDDNGKVYRVNVENGIGAGCDEEAIRLVKGAHYYAVKNKGIRVKTKKRFRIEFKLPPTQKVNYKLIATKSKNETKEASPSTTYSYSVKI